MLSWIRTGRRRIIVALVLANAGLALTSQPARADDAQFHCSTCISGSGRDYGCCVSGCNPTGPAAEKCCTQESQCSLSEQ
jgi:hypothetical protein